MHIFQFEEEEDAMQKAIALSLAIEKTKVDIVPCRRGNTEKVYCYDQRMYQQFQLL